MTVAVTVADIRHAEMASEKGQVVAGTPQGQAAVPSGGVVRILFLIGGVVALVLGAIGIALPLLPTVPFVILAAYCFARSSPRLERWLVDHPRFGPSIRAWRTHGAISRTGKRAAVLAFGASAALGLWLAPWPWMMLPVAAALVGGSWIWTRPTA